MKSSYYHEKTPSHKTSSFTSFSTPINSQKQTSIKTPHSQRSLFSFFSPSSINNKSTNGRTPHKIKKHYNQIDVHTIDFFQGQEKKIIIISLTKTKEKWFFFFFFNFFFYFDRSSYELLADWHRLNVAITRACCKLVFIGSLKAMESREVNENDFDQNGIGGNENPMNNIVKMFEKDRNYENKIFHKPTIINLTFQDWNLIKQFL
jgi:hypothetical protein